mmetsp:Transcript_3316/g.13274  ORF Transcript_3316/g.13274 Transcript_3316/m.13274 type:complete len:286 (+) Transcript_3316:326-1183(+)
MRKLDLSVQSSTTQEGGIQSVRPVGRRDHLDVVVALEPVQLGQQLEHRPLHFAVAGLFPAKALRADGIQLVDEDDGSSAPFLLDLVPGQLEGVAHHLGTVTDEHLDQLRPRKLQEHRVRLVRAGPCQKGLASAGRSVEQHALGRADADGIEHLLVRHGQHHRFDQLLDLLVTASDVAVLLGGLLVHLHGLHPRVVLSRQLLQNQVGILVGAHEVVRLELVRVHQARNRQENSLPRRGPEDGALLLAGPLVILVHRASIFLRQLSLVVVRLQDLHHGAHEVGKLLV